MLTYAQALAHLPRAEQTVIRLYVERGASPADVARAMGTTVDAVTATYASAQARLRYILDPVAA